MVAGRVIVPPPNTFAPCFQPVTDRARPFALGLSSNSFAGERKVVAGLVSGGPAAAAGLREGDEIVEFTDPLEVQKEPGMHMKIKVRRDGQEISIDYLPRGAEIEIYRWQRAAGVSDANCKV
jgi:predicted metalloprotease with PDZ domain